MNGGRAQAWMEGRWMGDAAGRAMDLFQRCVELFHSVWLHASSRVGKHLFWSGLPSPVDGRSGGGG